MRRFVAGTLLTVAILATVLFFWLALPNEQVILAVVGIPAWVGWFLIRPRPGVNADN